MLSNQHISQDLSKNHGVVYTPREIAEFLADWAITNSDSTVLDIGTGEGVFLIEAFKKLRKLGAEPQQVQRQIHGVELDASAINAFYWQWLKEVGFDFPNIRHGNIFDNDFSPVNAVIGNPPYVSRVRLPEIDHIRSRLRDDNGVLEQLGRLTDLYAYFIVYATRYLKAKGRLAVVISSSWLDVNYGVGFKQFLCEQYYLRAIIGFERKLFPDALVKPLLLLAEKKGESREVDSNIQFIRVKEQFKPKQIKSVLSNPVSGFEDKNLIVNAIPLSQAEPQLPWGIFLKTPHTYFSIADNELITKLSNLSYTRIGLQTLAKSFYIFDKERLRSLNLEQQFREPLAFSPREFSYPVIDENTQINYFLFYCDKPEEELPGTGALRHIEWGKNQKVPVRNKHEFVDGYHNQRRIQQAGRKPWYNIKTEVERRGRLPILIPRRIYETFLVIWNKVAVIPNEDFIEVNPSREGDLLPMLAILNSSFSEFVLRMHAQVYGGGVFNLNPGQIKQVPMIDVSRLSEEQQQRLISAYQQFISHKEPVRNEIDQIVFDILGFTDEEREELLAALESMKNLARKSKDRY